MAQAVSDMLRHNLRLYTNRKFAVWFAIEFGILFIALLAILLAILFAIIFAILFAISFAIPLNFTLIVLFVNIGVAMGGHVSHRSHCMLFSNRSDLS